MKSKTIKLKAELDLKTNKVSVDKISGDVWTDYAYWLEAVSFMAFQAMHSQDWDKKQAVENATQYIAKALDDYEDTWSKQTKVN